MKKFLCILTSAALVLSLTACSKTDVRSDGKQIHPDVIPVSEATGDYERHLENCKAKEYTNLDWTNTPRSVIPPISECYDIEADSNYPKLTNKEVIAKFEEQCKAVFGGDFDSNKMYFRAENRDYPEITVEGNGMTYKAGASLTDHRTGLENDDTISLIDIIYLDLDKFLYLWGFPDLSPIWLCKGSAIKSIGGDYRPTGLAPHDLLNIYPYETFHNDGTADGKTFRLVDGDYSVGEAIDYFVNGYYPSQPYDMTEGTSCVVDYVSSIKVNDDLYFYYLAFAPTWNGIPFDTQGEYTSAGSSGRNHFSYNCQAVIAKKNDVDMAYRFAPPMITEVKEPITKILPLEKAADIASESLSATVKFEVRTAKLIYDGPKNKETKIVSLHPAWKFILYNTNDDLYYNVYIDAVSGECSYYSYSTR